MARRSDSAREYLMRSLARVFVRSLVMHGRALARSSQYVGPRCGRGGKACRARGIGYRPRYVARGILRAAVAYSSRYPANWGEGASGVRFPRVS